MRKQRKSQLNQLASSSSSLLLASVVIRTTNKTFGPIEILARCRKLAIETFDSFDSTCVLQKI